MLPGYYVSSKQIAPSLHTLTFLNVIFLTESGGGGKVAQTTTITASMKKSENFKMSERTVSCYCLRRLSSFFVAETLMKSENLCYVLATKRSLSNRPPGRKKDGGRPFKLSSVRCVVDIGPGVKIFKGAGCVTKHRPIVDLLFNCFYWRTVCSLSLASFLLPTSPQSRYKAEEVKTQLQ